MFYCSNRVTSHLAYVFDFFSFLCPESKKKPSLAVSALSVDSAAEDIDDSYNHPDIDLDLDIDLSGTAADSSTATFDKKKEKDSPKKEKSSSSKKKKKKEKSSLLIAPPNEGASDNGEKIDFEDMDDGWMDNF